MIKNLEQIKQTIQEASAVLICAGAGMGVDSGLPDFRGDHGFWKAYPPLQKLNLSFSEMASSHWFENDPHMAWAFYGHRLHLYRATDPHEGFTMLKKLVEEKGDNYFIFTSNVDGQFAKAGFDETKIYECHGSIHYMQCSAQCCTNIWKNKKEIGVDMQNFRALNIPLCPKCAEVARPNILMFGDWRWEEKRAKKQERLFNKWLEKTEDEKRVIIEIGAGTAIATVRYHSEQITKRSHNTTLIRINPREYELDSHLGFSIQKGGLDGLRQLLL